MEESIGRAVWLEERRKGIGGTDAAAILGLSRWVSPLQVWLHKRNEAAPRVETEAMWWGLALESLIARRFAESAPAREVWQPTLEGRPRLIQHPEHRCLIGSPDYLLRRGDAGLDCKTARRDEDWGPEGTDEVPAAYIIQCQHYMALTGFPVWYVAALLAGSDFRVYEIRADADLQAFIVERCLEWWRQHIELGIRPEMDGTEETSRWLAHRFPEVKAPIALAPPEAEEIASLLHLSRAGIKGLEAVRTKGENALKEIIGESAGIDSDLWRATWKSTRSRRTVNHSMLAEFLYQRIMDHEKAWEEEGAAGPGRIESRAELLERFTEETPGSRRFLFTWKAKE